MTTERADEIIQATRYADHVEDSEEWGTGVVYTLDDGSAVLVAADGSITHVTE